MIIDDSDINDTDHYQGEKDGKCDWRRDNIEENDYEEKDGQNVCWSTKEACNWSEEECAISLEMFKDASVWLVGGTNIGYKLIDSERGQAQAFTSQPKWTRSSRKMV